MKGFNFNTTGATTLGGAKPAEQNLKLTTEQSNKKLDDHLYEINQKVDNQKQQFDQIYKQVFEFDKQNYQTNKKIDETIKEISLIENEQLQMQEYIRQTSLKQHQLFDILKQTPQVVDHQSLIQLGQMILQCQQMTEQWQTTGLEEMKRLNELHNYLTTICQQVGI
ncbi:Hypothetical_protein [Hexamita inflata]|uniref:Hypothetical_protein n=1 Tax=Hexamita inflata TaxID=28002 RepID=A0AA86UKT6_9EUKA|nr:Hypothetical protein HINF_LOCUS30948 [Hexamita inflata]